MLVVPVQPTIVAGAFAEIGPIIQSVGLDFDALLDQVDLKREDLDVPDRRISLNAVCELLENASVLLGNDAFALEVAQKYPAGSSGVVGYAMLTAPTLRQCLQDVERYMRLVTQQQQVRFIENGPLASVDWDFPENLQRPCWQYISMTAYMFIRRVRLAAGEDWQPESITLEVPRPQNIAAYIAVFGENIVFGAARSHFEFSSDILALAMPNSDERLHGLLRELGEYRLNELDAGSDIVDRTQDQIIALLNHGPVSLEMVARDLGHSARSLQRRLKEEGTTFQVVLEKTRRLLARHYLRTRQHTLTEVAFLLGFSEQSAFTRACKRWFDATPFEMRTRLRDV